MGKCLILLKGSLKRQAVENDGSQGYGTVQPDLNINTGQRDSCRCAGEKMSNQSSIGAETSGLVGNQNGNEETDKNIW